jgi:hypothetical protein
MRLGDVQRSAVNILDVVMQSRSFEQLAALRGVAGVSVQPYSEQFTDLRSYLDVSKGEVTTAAPTVADVASLLEDLTSSGDVRGPVAHLLRGHLEDAQRDLDKGRKQAAAGELERFIDRLDRPGWASTVTASAAAQLSAAAHGAIDGLRS